VALGRGQVASPTAIPFEESRRQEVLRELDRILESRFFRNAERSKQFLRYVVQHKLDHSEALKERTIGVELFERRHDYATGDDPVVRVQAGEVRRRLDQYYQAVTSAPPIRIEIPVGSYSPIFGEPSAAPRSGPVALDFALPLQDISHEKIWKKWKRYRLISALCIGLLAGAIAIGRHHATQSTAIDAFWSPVFATPQPVLVCLAKATVYRPTQALYERYARAHPGTFHTAIEKFDRFLPLDPKQQTPWGEMREDAAFGVARGDAYAAVTLSALLGKIGKPDQVRIGSDYSFSDLKNSPSVIVGAFNNRWTLQITSNLHFAFVEQNGRNMIREQGGSGAGWEERYRNDLEPIEDTAIVARLLDSGTGQFTIVVAGIGEMGTQAASELVSRADLLQQAIRNLPAGWQKKNLELVVQTTVTDSVPGPPHLIAAYSW
jgi:hypothetical protein